MKQFFGKFIIVTLFVIEARGKEIVSSQLFANNTGMQVIENLEVPDSALLLLNRLKLEPNKSLNISYIARQNQEGSGNDTSSRRCTCSLGICKCCTGFIMDLFNQKACMKVTYHPGDFAFDVAMSLNDRVLYENSMSGKNPRPICISPPRLSNLKVCAKFYNIYFPGRNLHFCLAMTGNWGSLQLLNFAFHCLRMGANGIAMIRPDQDDDLSIPNPVGGGTDAVIDAGDDDIEEYDENNVVRSLLEILDLDE